MTHAGRGAAAPAGAGPASAIPASREAAAAGVTWLFVPGDRPDRFAKAIAAGPDQVILDLEDAVGPGHKDHAREVVSRYLGDHGRFWVRVNSAGSPWWRADLDALAGRPGLAGVLIPKCESASELAGARRVLGPDTALAALIESARGVSAAPEIAACPEADRLAFGSIDFALDINADHDELPLLTARSLLVLAARLGGLPAPIDGVTAAVRDAGRCRTDAERSRRLGFGGKLCVHPAQVAHVMAAFRPTQEEITWARTITGGATGGAVAIDGQMVDVPVVRRAEAILRRAGFGADGD